jgi:Fe-S cluster biosynthesis and repair protein YggX
MPDRIVHCRMHKKDLPGLSRPPYKNELGQKIYAEVSQDAWGQWLKDSVKLINTYRVDLAAPEGQKFMLDQCAIYFKFQEGEVAGTAWTPPAETDAHAGHGHEGHDHAGHDHAGHGHDHSHDKE